MRVAELWRYPVKSLQGERLSLARVGAFGLDGDREWGILDAQTGHILSGRRAPELLFGSARLVPSGGVEITLPDGQVLSGPGARTDAGLSRWLGRSVRLVRADAVGAGVVEYFEDATDDASRALTYAMPDGHLFDTLPLLLLTSGSIRAGQALHPDGVWNTRRFRPNVLIDVGDDGWVEDEWCGRTVCVGEVVLSAVAPCPRCTMVTRPQPGLERDLDVFRVLARGHNANFGVWASVSTGGVVHLDDEVALATA